ncbi:transcriptional regulator, LysR family [Limimonas halophila]|uniref:Transcriptional regulator, LysR family n=1 Tax=Limimonas halophila TaxID=1082479 RepID=A0A1G7QNV2_9PROT|nr:LysR family transcriptional regulator [Limimonas halophila]SDG00195.1 transcriptional regulator, LysR family [Limimonas halophila]
MDPELLRAFVSVAESRGFTAAARALNRTQSAVSLQIKRLEEQIGDSLFTRTSRSVELTGAGSALLPYARRILRLQDEAEAAVTAVTATKTLRIGISEEQAAFYLPGVIPTFAREHPDVRLEVVCDLSSRLVEHMQEGKLDLALTIRHEPTATGEVIGQERLVWVAGHYFPAEPGTPLPLALNPTGCIFRAHAIAALARAQRPWSLVYMSASPTGMNLALDAGMALSVKARRSVPESCRIVDEAFDLPALPPVDVELHRSATAVTEAADTFARLLMRAVTASEDVTAMPSAVEMAQGQARESDSEPTAPASGSTA